jgi:hypothetical protein
VVSGLVSRQREDGQVVRIRDYIHVAYPLTENGVVPRGDQTLT